MLLPAFSCKMDQEKSRTAICFLGTPVFKIIIIILIIIIIIIILLLHEKFLQFDWLRAVVFQLNLKYLHVKITNLLRVVI